MEKVFLMVELIDEKEGLVYAINYTGVMTRRNIYAKLTQVTGCPDPEYIKVSVCDTIDRTKYWQSIYPKRSFRHIEVNSDIGMTDCRIQKINSFPDGVLEAIQQHIQENNELLATL